MIIGNMNIGPIGERSKALVDVTPEIAKEILATTNENNYRKASATTVELYAADMTRGQWSHGTGETIKFGPGGRRLLDGQHRLMGVVASGVTVKLWFETDVEESALEFMDQGRGRTWSELGKMSSAPIQVARIFIRVLKREWDCAFKVSYQTAKPVLDEIGETVQRVQEKIFRTAGARSSAPVRAAMVYNILIARTTGQKAKVLDLIGAWCNLPGTVPTRLHQAFHHKYPENPSGQKERMARFLEAIALFDPEANQDRGTVATVNQVERDRVRKWLIAALGDSCQALIGPDDGAA